MKFKPEMPQGKKENNLELYEDAKRDLIDCLDEIAGTPAIENYQAYTEKQLAAIRAEKELEISDEEKKGFEALKYVFTVLEQLAEARGGKAHDEKVFNKILETLAKEDLNELFLAAELYHLVDVNSDQIVPESKEYDHILLQDKINEAIAVLKTAVLNLAKAKLSKEYKEQVKEYGESWEKIDKGRSYEAGIKRVNKELREAMSREQRI